MDGVQLDGGSSRRGSLNSLHRQSSGSFSHSSKLVSPATGLQVNTNNLNSVYKDLDKFTRYFIIKAVQVIVQSRIGENKRVKTECKSNGNDWFNINVSDIPEVSDRTKAALDSEGFSVKSNWRVCCEISLQTSDGGRLILEHWIISNKNILNSSQNNLPFKLISNQISPKSNQANLFSPTQLSTSNNGVGPLNANNLTSTSPRVRPATFSSTMRTRLNSIDDCSSDKNYPTNRLVNGPNNENFDIKSSTSCFSLSSTPANQVTDQVNSLTTSPSTNSLTDNPTQGQSNNVSNNSTQQQQGFKTSASIYTIYNRMSLLLKTLMTTTHIVPAYRLASRSSQSDSYVICYRVYINSSHPHQASSKTNPVLAKDSNEDLTINYTDSPTKRSSSSSTSFGSVNIRDFVGASELEHFCPILKLGSVKTEVNELDVSLCYRTDVKNSHHLIRSPRLQDIYNKILDEDCITAAKQLLAANNHANGYHKDNPERHHHDETQEFYKSEVLDCVDQPLRPAFAAKEEKFDNKNSLDPNLEIIDSAFNGLLKINNPPIEDDLIKISCDAIINPEKRPCKSSVNRQGRSTNAQSEPIQVPTSGSNRSKQPELYQNSSFCSTPKSLTDSFVFVDLNPPFASEEQNDINSFFNGPSPVFSNGFDSLKDVDELTNQLAVIEANASQIDEFVDNICVSEDEEEERDRCI